MQYFGGKAKIAKELSSFINSELKDNQSFIDMFCGSCNVVSRIDSSRKRVANDLHTDLILLHKAVQDGWLPPSFITESEHKLLRHSDSSALRGFVGFGCSYSGDWFKGYSKNNTERNYALNAKNSLLKKHLNLKDVLFLNQSYHTVIVDSFDYIYCDIPYNNTTQYSTGAFNHDQFYKWVEEKVSAGCVVRISEYSKNIPEGYEVVWSTESRKDIRNKENIQEKTTEVLIKKIGAL